MLMSPLQGLQGVRARHDSRCLGTHGCTRRNSTMTTRRGQQVMMRAYVDPGESKAWHKLDCKHVVRVSVAMLPAAHATQRHTCMLMQHKQQCSSLAEPRVPSASSVFSLSSSAARGSDCACHRCCVCAKLGSSASVCSAKQHTEQRPV